MRRLSNHLSRTGRTGARFEAPDEVIGTERGQPCTRFAGCQRKFEGRWAVSTRTRLFALRSNGGLAIVILLLIGGGSLSAQPLTFSTLAGHGGPGMSDGVRIAAGFNSPSGVAADTNGNIYLADTANHTIRKVNAAGVVTTLAGIAGVKGSSDGTNQSALFNEPRGLALDGLGTVYVADSGNHTIRKITPSGVTTTFAGYPGLSGSGNGLGTNAQFFHPEGVAVDVSGNVFVADTWNHTIRK